MSKPNFFKNLMSADSDRSSKRFISIYSLGLLTIVIVAALFKVVVQDSIIYALVSLIIGSSVMTLSQNNSNSNAKTTTIDKSETTTIQKNTTESNEVN